ncbi:MAG: cupin domain-containing protein [Rhodospirillaceae bacterium]|jgi:quercetin dioxygenase-like cupin family protein|nr:cupin domain-containing protein [Rhodospirillaceae bacterium]MBT5456565.1 cupin domain-containing protein [Rhodospirillaceae bacterium]
MDGIQQNARGRRVVSQPDDGASYWCPVPANGFAHPKLVPANTGFDGLSMGFQSIPPGSNVREHSHTDAIELQIGFSGTGRAVIDGTDHAIAPGAACFIGYDVKHEIHNESDEELVMLWMIAPAGLEDYFQAIGRTRQPGETAPDPFARPTDSAAIDQRVGMQAGGDSSAADNVHSPDRNPDVVGKVVVVPPGEGASYWQPKPADGFADNVFLPANTGFDGLTMGFQTVPPGRYIRDHAHETEIEMHICMEGAGSIDIDGETHKLVPGTSCFVGYGVNHKIINDGDDDLVMAWVIAPGGLDDHLASIGKLRVPGDPPPDSFERSPAAGLQGNHRS